mgnify:FL=1
MMLDAIFDGTFNPSEMPIRGSKKFTQACHNTDRLLTRLSKQLSHEDYGLVEDLTNELLNSCDEECKLHFKYGFSAGLLLMHEAYDSVQAQVKDD